MHFKKYPSSWNLFSQETSNDDSHRTWWAHPFLLNNRYRYMPTRCRRRSAENGMCVLKAACCSPSCTSGPNGIFARIRKHISFVENTCPPVAICPEVSVYRPYNTLFICVSTSCADGAQMNAPLTNERVNNPGVDRGQTKTFKQSTMKCTNSLLHDGIRVFFGKGVA